MSQSYSKNCVNYFLTLYSWSFKAAAYFPLSSESFRGRFTSTWKKMVIRRRTCLCLVKCCRLVRWKHIKTFLLCIIRLFSRIIQRTSTNVMSQREPLIHQRQDWYEINVWNMMARTNIIGRCLPYLNLSTIIRMTLFISKFFWVLFYPLLTFVKLSHKPLRASFAAD